MSKSMEKTRFVIAVIAPAVTAVLICVLSVGFFQQYGWTLFVLTPVLIGAMSALILSPNGEKSFGKCLAASLCSILLIAFLILVVAFEGIVCLIMTAPFAFALDLIGVLIGKGIAKSLRDLKTIKLLPLILIIPFLLAFESSTKTPPVLHRVTTAVEINAPIEKVWQNIIAFPEINKKPEGILRFGFAYPVDAKIEGVGVGAIRYCNFDTGAFVEPITVWQEPNLLAFDVKEQPRPMTETSFYSNLHAPHLDFLKSQRGQFRLYEQNGKTVVEGTTFYTHDISPDFYWKLWSDYIIHQIHLRVLNRIKEVSEIS